MRRGLVNFLKNIEGFCTEDLIEEAEPLRDEVVDYFCGRFGDEGAIKEIMSYLSTILTIDGDVGPHELYFFRELFQIRLVDSMIENYFRRNAMDMITFTHKFDALPYDIRYDLAALAICACGADAEITRNESNLLYRLINTL